MKQVKHHIFENFVWNTNLSNVAARMYFPLGENFTNDTGGLLSSTIKQIKTFFV